VTRSKCTFRGWFTPTSANFEPTLNGSKISLRGLLSNEGGFIEIKDFGLGSFPCQSPLLVIPLTTSAKSMKSFHGHIHVEYEYNLLRMLLLCRLNRLRSVLFARLW